MNASVNTSVVALQQVASFCGLQESSLDQYLLC